VTVHLTITYAVAMALHAGWAVHSRVPLGWTLLSSLFWPCSAFSCMIVGFVEVGRAHRALAESKFVAGPPGRAR
jgi:hypothetical protein